MWNIAGWSENDAAVAGSEDQPDSGFEIRVPGCELEGTRLRDQSYSMWAKNMKNRERSQ